MIILSVDTSGPVASVALMRDGRIAHEIVMNHGLTHSETLMPMIDQLMEASNLALEKVDMFTCVAGPGSFTGVRIGICAVKAMAFALNKPCISLDALEVLAADAYGVEGTICPMLDARRDQVYAAAFVWQNNAIPARIMEDAALSIGDYFDALPQTNTLYFTGDGVKAHEQEIIAHFGSRARIAPMHRQYLRASAACYLAQHKLNDVIEPINLMPIYLRAPQAERERLERER